MTAAPRTGRRRGNPDTRSHIIESARELFTQDGFDSTSVRGVARHAGVDPALIHRWFDGKSGLLMAAIGMEKDLGQLLGRVFAHDRSSLGARLAKAMLTLWDSPMTRVAIDAFRGTPALHHALLTYLNGPLVDALMSELHLPEAEARVRVGLVQSVLGGVALTRLLAPLPPMNRIRSQDLADTLAPLLQHCLTGRLPAGAVHHAHPREDISP